MARRRRQVRRVPVAATARGASAQTTPVSAWHDGEARRLADERGVGQVASAKHRPHPVAAALLLDHGADDRSPRQVVDRPATRPLPRPGTRRARLSCRRLHGPRCGRRRLPGPRARAPRIAAVDRHDVDVAGQVQRAAPTGSPARRRPPSYGPRTGAGGSRRSGPQAPPRRRARRAGPRTPPPRAAVRQASGRPPRNRAGSAVGRAPRRSRADHRVAPKGRSPPAGQRRVQSFP